MSGSESVFTLDVGSATQDFVLFAEENVRNCPKAVLPSPTRILASRIERIGKDIFLRGYTMGGGAITFAVKKHLEKYRVYATQRAALTFSDDLDRVREMGIIIGEPEGEREFAVLETKDVDMPFFASLIERIGYEMPEYYVVAVQDHGFSPKISNRVFRFRMFEKLLRRNSSIEGFLFNYREIPDEFNRMKDAAQCVLDFLDAEVYVVDTVFAAIAGCAMQAKKFPALVANFGNSHLTAAIVDEDYRIKALMEHHTPVLRKRGVEEIAKLLERFERGEISNEFVLDDGGHGCYYEEVSEVKERICTGPNADLSPFKEVSGDPMVVGNFGMMFLLKRKLI